MMIIAIIMRPWVCEMKSLGVIPRILADDLFTLAADTDDTGYDIVYWDGGGKPDDVRLARETEVGITNTGTLRRAELTYQNLKWLSTLLTPTFMQWEPKSQHQNATASRAAARRRSC